MCIRDSPKGVLAITTRRVFWLSDTDVYKGGLYFFYPYCSSHGIQKKAIICFLTDGRDDTEADAGDEDEGQVEEEERDLFIERFSQKSATPLENIFEIKGDYNIIFDLPASGLEDVSSVFRLMSECSAMNEDIVQGNNPLENDNLEDNELITGAHIDDNGFVVAGSLNGDGDGEDDDGEYEDGEEDEEEGEIKPEGAMDEEGAGQMTNNQGGAGGKPLSGANNSMHIE
eukprot:TRINITY_DN6524_c0_g1_i1.p1 TRINITY_DN6524_c0_g1~~TRINITY_DN6524_c0_g1_i1.p1  ORF type:complete len:251 (+),score=96.53 TRINITY_DN6524_c0_g1_i1:71-754(+)